MYLAHFGLTEAPFSITPDPRFLYMSDRHREALAHLVYGVGAGGGFVQLTGEVGTGKTSICRCLLEQLPPHVDVALILNPRLTAVELLATVCDELRVSHPPGTTSLKVLVDALHRHLLDAHARGRRTVLIIDEAQSLDADVLEEIRLLTNLETTKEKLLQVILIGQPELARLLDQQELRQLAQRVTARYHLLPLSRDDTHAYVRHRMAVAGRGDRVFSEAAVRRVHRLSGGVPRLINVICDRALLGAYTEDRDRVDAATAGRAAAEVLGRSVAPRARRSLLRIVAVAGGVAACAGAVVLLAPAELNRTAGGAKLAEVATPVADRGAPTGSSGVAVSDREAVQRADPGAVGSMTSEAVTHAEGDRTRSTRLGDLLRDPSLRVEKRDAFANMYARWGLDYRESQGEAACDGKRLRGLECVFRIGTWRKVRRFGVPAIIELVPPTGERRYATVTALGDDVATLVFGERSLTYPLKEIDPFWEGSFILLWKPPPGPIPIRPGARGKQVEWVRERLGEVDGALGARGSSDTYDDELSSRVVAFQRARSLVADGVVGIETALLLAAAARQPGIPWLSEPTP